MQDGTKLCISFCVKVPTCACSSFYFYFHFFFLERDRERFPISSSNNSHYHHTRALVFIFVLFSAMDLHLRTRNLFINHTTTTAPTTSPSFHEFVSVFYIPPLVFSEMRYSLYLC